MLEARGTFSKFEMLRWRKRPRLCQILRSKHKRGRLRYQNVFTIS